MFYAITATMTVLIVIGLAFTLVAMFRSIASRLNDHDLVVAHAVYWYSLTAIFAAMWLVVYVQK
jgi:heme/copper-type cytochrome/quinol oxidase subunit 3